MKKRILPPFIYHFFLYFSYLFFFIPLFNGVNAFSQSACPSVSVSPSSVDICSGCTNLTATVQGTVETTSYSVAPVAYVPFSYNTGMPILVNIDDTWSDPIAIPFCFQFYGNTYNQLLIGSNGIMTFDLSMAGGFCDYNLTLSPGIPDATLPMNSVMAPYQDIDPTNMGSIYWQVIGTAPCRSFIISTYQVPYYGDPNSVSTGSCPNPLFATSQIVLYETTNIIDIYIQDKPNCTGWNNGFGIEGIQNATGTLATVVPGRNNTVWSATNDAYRFTPAGAPQFNLTWYSPSNTVLGTSAILSVCPTDTTIYTATVVNNTCNGPITVSETVTVNYIGIESITISPTSTACAGNTGTATATVTGSTTPYTYLWNPSSQTTQTATGLSAGTYTVIVTGANGCIDSNTVIITTTPLVTFSFPPVTNVDCFGNSTGSASVTILTGSSPYTYAWSPTGQTTSTASNLSEGSYTVTVTDFYGCSHTDSITITSPTLLSHSFSGLANVTCFGGTNGSTTVNVSGGTPSYTYLWSNAQTSQTATGLAAGTHTIIVTDANGCSFLDSVTITSPLPFSHSFSGISNVDCFGNPVGAATINVSGGTLPYNYSWNTIPVQTTQTATALYAGVFTVMVTDSNACTFSDSVTITTPTGLGVYSPVITNVDCFGDSTGVATVTPFGGTPGYFYSWSPTSQTTATATGLFLGVYTITVTDNNGCIISTLVQITESPLLTSTPSQVNILCFGDSTGSATVLVAGGSIPYTYLWTPAAPAISSNTGLAAGVYSLLITDSLGCTLSNSFTLTQTAFPLSADSSFINVLCNPDSTGEALVIVTGGSPAYSYLWNTGQTDSVISAIPAGNYSVMITDLNGCQDSSIITISQPTLLNFTSSQVNILCFGDSSGTVAVSVTGGTPAYTYLWSPAISDSASANGLPVGTYSLLITDNNGCSLDSTYIIAQPAAPLSLTNSFVNVLCNPDSSGSAAVVATGGTPSYSYLWSTGQTTAGISNLPAGNYSVMVTDTNGCLDSTSLLITQPTLFLTSISPDTSLCSSASITETITAIGGTPTYNYLWMPGGASTSSITVNPSVSITYTVQVSDANGCATPPLNTSISVVQMPVATISVSPSPVVFFPETICFTTDTTNATTWLWDFGDNSTASVNSVCHDFAKRGTYCVTLLVTNSLGCSDSSETCVTEVEVVVPNVFSPNGDDQNDTFFISLLADGITYFRCEIFDRWGLKMAELNRPKQGWEGFTTSGSPASDGTYYFVLSISWGNELSIHKEGFLSLIR